MTQTILIAAASFDEHAYGPVATRLARRGYGVVVYKTDKLLSGEDRFVVEVCDGAHTITYNETSIRADDVSAAWYRKVASFGLADAHLQLAKQLYMNNEIRALHDTIWPSFYPDELWLSAPTNIARADRKLFQLMVANEAGFTVPKTVVSSDWHAINASLFVDEREQVIVKMMRGVISQGNEIKALPTTILTCRRIDELEKYTSPFPGIYQPYVPKAREWRVTVVEHDVFPVAIYTDESAKDDWRLHQNSDAVRFKHESLPDGIAALCIDYLGRLKLGFGAFDLIEQPDGQIVFLECNPNGQYGWLEEDLGLPISDSIADALIRIAEHRI